MKNIKLLLFFISFPVSGFSQELTGVWTGTLSNDSTTIRKDQTFEIALTEYRGKVYGYAYSTFIVNDTLYYIIKRVKGDVNGKICEIKDDEVVTHNFQRPPEKGVSVVYTFRHNQEENLWTIDGNWKTNKTKEYYSVSGDVNAKAEKDLSRSRLFEHLGDLNLQNTLVFDKTKNAKPEKRTLKEKTAKEEVVKLKAGSGEKKSGGDIAKQKEKNESGNKEKNTTSNKPSADLVKSEIKKPDEKNSTGEAEQKEKENQTVSDIAKSEMKKPEIKKETTSAEQKRTTNNPVTDIAKSEIRNAETRNDLIKPEQKPEGKNTGSGFVFTDVKRAERKIRLAAAMVEERISVPSETIYFRSDSLVLALYDNGEIDGDTVSVLLNGELIIEKQGLKSVAFKKTIYLAPDETDSILLVLYAENLGIYPPNTGLLIVKDGEDSYYVRFKADYEKNAAIMFRRKLK